MLITNTGICLIMYSLMFGRFSFDNVDSVFVVEQIEHDNLSFLSKDNINYISMNIEQIKHHHFPISSLKDDKEEKVPLKGDF